MRGWNRLDHDIHLTPSPPLIDRDIVELVMVVEGEKRSIITRISAWVGSLTIIL